MYGGGGQYGGGGHYDGSSGGGQYGGGGHYDGSGGAGNANSLFGGGGFMPSQSTNNPEGSSGLPKTRSTQTLLPLTVKQIMDAVQTNDDKSNFAVNGTEVSTVRLVGRMLNKEHRVTDVRFFLDDGTGCIGVNRWENGTSDTNEMHEVNDGDYVIVNGGLKSFSGNRSIVAYSVRRVTNFNDITHHFLHCIHVHLELANARSKVNASNSTPNQAMTWNQAPLSNNQAPTISPSGVTAGTELSDLVMNVFHEPAFINLEHGITVDQVTRRLNISEEAARSAIQHLMDMAQLYSTIDDHHYKSTLNG